MSSDLHYIMFNDFQARRGGHRRSVEELKTCHENLWKKAHQKAYVLIDSMIKQIHERGCEDVGMEPAKKVGALSAYKSRLRVHLGLEPDPVLQTGAASRRFVQKRIERLRQGLFGEGRLENWEFTRGQKKFLFRHCFRSEIRCNESFTA